MMHDTSPRSLGRALAALPLLALSMIAGAAGCQTQEDVGTAVAPLRAVCALIATPGSP